MITRIVLFAVLITLSLAIAYDRGVHSREHARMWRTERAIGGAR